jgi:hypothetical protein
VKFAIISKLTEYWAHFKMGGEVKVCCDMSHNVELIKHKVGYELNDKLVSSIAEYNQINQR